MRSRRTFQILLLLYFRRHIIRQRKKRKHRFWIRDIFRKRRSWEKWNCFMKCTETIAFSFMVLFLKSFRVTSIQHSIIFHNIYQLVIKPPPHAYRHHDELYYFIAVGCSDWLSSCGERKNRTCSYLIAETCGTPLRHLRCVTEFLGSNRKCLRCGTVSYVALRNFLRNA